MSYVRESPLANLISKNFSTIIPEHPVYIFIYETNVTNGEEKMTTSVRELLSTFNPGYNSGIKLFTIVELLSNTVVKVLIWVRIMVPNNYKQILVLILDILDCEFTVYG